MSEAPRGPCPSLSTFEERLDSTALETHIRHCRACGIVHDLVARRRDAAHARDRRAECTRVEDLLAARAEVALGPAAEQTVVKHLAGCAECRPIALALAGDP